MNNLYKKQVALLIRIIPSVYRIEQFAIHGGTAINLFLKDLPRYSVDIDLTFIPIKERNESLNEINTLLAELKKMIERSIPNIKIVHKTNVWKLHCTYEGVTVKIEVNNIKRGIIDYTLDLPLSLKAQEEFQMSCVARIVPTTQLNGGKIAAALSRQHPRDLFDCKYMDTEPFEKVKNGFFLCLLGSDKPIVESLNPHLINQSEALENQFKGMSNIPFSYKDYESSRNYLIKKVNDNINEDDKLFLLSFEKGEPDWEKCCAGNLNQFPSIKWKLQNILKLKKKNYTKYKKNVEKLRDFLQI